MMKTSGTTWGIVLGFFLYAIYTLTIKRNSPVQTNKGQEQPLETILPGDVTAQDACTVLKTSYHIGENVDEASVNPSALYHWKNLNCEKIVNQNSNYESHISKDSLIEEKAPSPSIQFDPPKSISQAVDGQNKRLGWTLPEVPIAKPLESSNKVQSVNEETCIGYLKTYDVVPGSSWGSLPIDLQRKWTVLRCDLLVAPYVDKLSEESAGSSLVTQEESPVTRRGDTGASKVKPSPKLRPSLTGKAQPSSRVGLPKISSDSESWCVENRKRYHVIPMQSWGTLPMNMIDSWRNNNCDRVFTVQRMATVPITTCDKGNFANGSLPLIAVMAATTTRKVTNPSTDNMALFSFLLPSLLRTVDCGYRYVYILGFDKGDPYYDDDNNMLKIKKWFKDNVEELMKKNGIKISFKTVKVNNTLRKPGPVFNEMARVAYELGSQYFYRVNDDTELVSHWPSVFVKTLESLSGPGGVVGPTCRQGNQGILTHDFVSRKHMEIFDMNYYPPQLVDWWMDDWISLVYGQKRTFKSTKVLVVHHTGAHGKRYEVDHENEKLLGKLVVQGRNLIRKWMLKNGVSDDDLKEFDSDDYNRGFMHRDSPEFAYS